MSGGVLFLLGVVAGLALAAAGLIGLAAWALTAPVPPPRQGEGGAKPCG